MTELTKSLGDTVAEKIKESIFSRRLFEPGQQLPKEAELAARFNVSRTALREAIKKLEAENILIIRRGVGTFVSEDFGLGIDTSGLSYEELQRQLLNNWYEARLIWEVPSMALVVKHATREEIEAIFKAGGITAKNMWADPRAYALEGAENIPAMEAYRQGKISLQGLASMVAANQAALNGGIILDVCAAPGGKSCNIAEQCPEAKVYAFDLHPHRVALISAQAERLGLPNVIAAQHDATQPFEEFEGIADCVLVDAPCTGLGTACHRPDVKWNKKQEDAAALAKLQRQILQNASRSVKPGGKLIYCTCTFTQTENEDVVGWFLANNAAFHLTPLTLPKNMPGHSDEKSGMLRLWPQIHQTDGFFICAMEKIS